MQKAISVLVIDDDTTIRTLLQTAMSKKGFNVFCASNGRDGLDIARSEEIDVVLLDWMMPEMDGMEVLTELKRDSNTMYIPVFMLTSKEDSRDIELATNKGAVDYIVKPFDPDALLARIRMILRRTVRSLDANPLTHLPGNTSIMEELQRCIDTQKTFAVAYADLDKFKVYNDKYGFEKGDEVIRETARLLVKISREESPEAFIGHIGGDDFVVVTDDAVIDKICRRAVTEFDKSAPQFYNEEDRQAGFIMGKDRLGNVSKTPLLSISIGIVSNAAAKITHVAQIGEIGAELKKYAKSFDKSNFVRDQRKK